MALPPEDLALVAASMEPRIITRSGERAYRTIIWVGVATGEIYIRSFLGDSAKWYRRAMANSEVELEIDGKTLAFRAVSAADGASVERASAALAAKYPKGRNLEAMLRDEVLPTTLRLDPR